MVLDPVRESLDGLSEPIAQEYAEYQGDDPDLKGKYVLSVNTAGGFSVENVRGLKSALENEKDTRRNLRTRLDRFVDGNGKPLDPSVVLEALEKLAQLEADQGQDPKPADGAIPRDQYEERERRWKRERKALEDERDGARTSLDSYIVKTEAMTAISKHDGIPRALLPHVLAVAKLREIEGKRQVVILNDNGQPRISERSGNTGLMDLDEFVGEILKHDKDFRGNYKGTDATGGGMDTPGSHPSGVVKIDPKLPATEKLRLARQAQRRSGS